MLYIITEDTGSRFQFWKNIGIYLKDIYEGLSVRVESSGRECNTGGISCIYSKLEEIERYVSTKSDIIYVAIDNANHNAKVNNYLVKVNHKIRHIRDKGINVLLTRYYCYEEVFLSWKELCKVCNITDKDVLFLLDYVRDSIYNNIEYSYVISKGIYSGVIKNLGGNNREKVASSLLGIITNKVGRHISKDEYDLCWINDCCNPFPSNDKRYNHIENNKQVTNCSLRSTLPTFTDKYEMLIRDTILNESLSELLTELDKRYKRKTTKEHNILTVNEQGTNYITQTTHHTAKINIPTKPTIQTHQPTAPRIKGF